MANSQYIRKLDSTVPHADFANQIGGLLASFNPVTYYRVKALHEDILEVSRLARRPKQMKTEAAPIEIENLFATLEELKAAEQENTEPTTAEPKKSSRRSKSELLGGERIEAIRLYMNTYLSKLDFGPRRKGERTAAILILLTLGLSPDQVVTMMQALGWRSFTSKGTVMQRRRGLRIRGWEYDFCMKHNIQVNPADIK